MHGVWEVAAITAIVFGRGTNVPTNFAMLTKGASGGGGDVGNNFGAWRSQGSAIVVELSKHGGVSRERGMDTRGP